MELISLYHVDRDCLHLPSILKHEKRAEKFSYLTSDFDVGLQNQCVTLAARKRKSDSRSS